MFAAEAQELYLHFVEEHRVQSSNLSSRTVQKEQWPTRKAIFLIA